MIKLWNMDFNTETTELKRIKSTIFRLSTNDNIFFIANYIRDKPILCASYSAVGSDKLLFRQFILRYQTQNWACSGEIERCILFITDWWNHNHRVYNQSHWPTLSGWPQLIFESIYKKIKFDNIFRFCIRTLSTFSSTNRSRNKLYFRRRYW